MHVNLLLLIFPHATLRQNPAFGPMQVRDLTEIFVKKSNEVCPVKSCGCAAISHVRCPWVASRLLGTRDPGWAYCSQRQRRSEQGNIGHNRTGWYVLLSVRKLPGLLASYTGFGYDFNALNLEGNPTELSIAFRKILEITSTGAVSLLGHLVTLFPFLALIVSCFCDWARIH